MFSWYEREGGSTVLQSSQKHCLLDWTVETFTLKNKMRKYSKNVQKFSFILSIVMVTGMGRIN